MPGTVGATAPWMTVDRRQTIRAPINPLDKSTIVSIFPMDVEEKKHTIFPSIFKIAAGTFINPSILVVGPSSWWKDVGDEQPLLEIPQSSIIIAESFVRDFCVGILGCDMQSKQPGIFYIPGEHTVEEIKKNHMPMLLKYQEMQKRWYAEQVKIADILWARSNGNPLAISDHARVGCKELGIKDKPWLKDFQTMQLVPCVACGELRNPEFPICKHCKAVADPKKAKELNLVFAQ